MAGSETEAYLLGPLARGLSAPSANGHFSRTALYSAIFAITVGTPAAIAQEAAEEPTPDVSPAEDARPADDTERPYRFNMGFGLSRSHDDNIYATPDSTESAGITAFSPWLTLSSDWDRHALALSARAETARHSGYRDEDYTDYSLRLQGRYDLEEGNNLFGSLTTRRLHEERTAVDLPGAALEPTTYREHQGVGGIALGFDRSTLRLGLTVRELDFDPVPLEGSGTLSNQDRDRTQYELGGRWTHLGEAAWQPFAQAALDWRRYREDADRFGYERSSDGSAVALGMTRDIGATGYAEFFVGHMQQSYDDPRFDRISTWDAGARIEAAVTPRTSVELQADRSIGETTIAASPGSIDNVATVSVDHRITPRLTASVPAYWIRSDFQQSDRRDHVTGAGISLDYRLNRHLSLTAGHSFQRRDSTEPDANYEQGITFVGLEAELAGRPILPLPPNNPGNGFYAGLQAGPSLLSSDVDGPRGPAAGDGRLTAGFGDLTSVGGGFLGYAWNQDRWQFALEAELDEGSGSWDHRRSEGARDFSVERGTSLAGSARLGYWLNPAAQLYGRAGLAFTEFTTDYQHGGHPVREDDTQRGVRLGTGAEVTFNPRWFGRMEWSHTGYHGYDATDADDRSDRFENRESTIRLGVGYRFYDASTPDIAAVPDDAFDGPYLGVQGGAAWLHTDNRGEDRGQDGSGTLRADRADDGLQAGVFAGYGQRLGSSPIYLGVELEAENSDAGWESARTPNRRNYSAERGSGLGAGIRVGYLLEGALLYARIGHVRSKFDTDYQFAGESVDIRDRRTLSGLRTGFGLEMPASENLFVRLDYSYTDYGSYRIDYATSTSDSAQETFDHDEATFQVGIGYRF